MMKNLLITIVVTSSIIGLFSLSSCQYNPCKARAVQCENKGFCMEGECVCVDAWEGDSCQYPINEKFDSYYAMIRTELINNTVIYDNDDTLIVTANPTVRNEINFVSIRDTASFGGWTASVSGNMVIIEEQTIGSADYYGDGSLNDEVLTITLFKEDPVNNTSSKTTYVGYQYETP